MHSADLVTSHYVDARIEEKKKYYGFTFLGSILVIAVLSFFMVWWMTEICEAAGIPVPVSCG